MARVKAAEITEEQFKAYADDAARLIVDNRALAAQRDAEIQAIQDKYNPEIDAADKLIEAKITMCEAYAKTHRKDLFRDGSKTAETNLAFLSFRYGNPTLKTLSSKNTWEDVIAALKADKKAALYVKTKEECDKRALLKQPAEWLARFLLRVTQSETFGIEPKTDKIG